MDDCLAARFGLEDAPAAFDAARNPDLGKVEVEVEVEVAVTVPGIAE